MMEYHAATPPSAPSGTSSAVIEPTSNRSPGKRSRLNCTVRGERSTPNTSTPSPFRYAVTPPGPHPASTTGPDTISANAVRTARSHGSAADSPTNRSAYWTAIAS
jgi:hypothetical protein